MARTLFSRIVLRKLSEITNNKPILISTIFFYSYKYFFNLRFNLFSIIAKEFNQNRNIVVFVAACLVFVLLCTHYGLLQCFSRYFRKLKETRVLRPIFPDYGISCDYDFMKIFRTDVLKNSSVLVLVDIKLPIIFIKLKTFWRSV